MDINKEIKNIEKEEARLARKRQALASKLKKVKVEEAKLETLFKNSGYKTPKALIVALMEKFSIRISKRKAKASSRQTHRRRTKVTPELRNTIKKDLKNSMSMNAASKKYGISYAVIAKIKKGVYDKLK